MEAVPEQISFPKTEEGILAYWKKIDAFKTSLKRSEGLPEYSFYDGPPFATGLPHYGHILAGTIKDTVTRYAHQTGHHVTRRFGWDTHGLPIEFEIDKQFGVKTKDDVLKMGIPTYNEHCRSIVMRYSSEWETIVSRLGRWIDFENDYKTLDTDFMESVWWVFKRLYEKNLVYRGFKVMPYSTACTTPLSNFEANMLYKEVSDPSVIISFPMVDEPEVKLLAWTTTPWTLPSNLALCVNPELVYIKLKDLESKETYIVCENRLDALYPALKKEKGRPKPEDLFTVLAKMKGAELKGIKYLPLFPYFEKERENGAFQVLVDNYVTDDSGTGVVHCAPAFGEDDYRVCAEAGLIRKDKDIPCPVNESGIFTDPVAEFKGKHVKDADVEIIKTLKQAKRLVSSGKIMHSYPFCWRSETPLIYKAVPSLFVRVEEIRDKLLANNAKTYWVPDWVKDQRFHNWLKDAHDWSVSRNRYWGTPIPMWVNPEHPDEVIVIGSIEELEKLSGFKATDLHRHNIDHVTIPSPSGRGVLKRVEEVFDCWFESGSMPYAQLHYPFENKELFEASFPADFIAEGIDQTRGWFYTLLVLSTALFDQPAFKNVIVNGLVLASDGKKMSKRLKNYPDPVLVVDKYGADALRLYLINSPVVRGQELRFVEAGVKDVVKDVFLPWFNAYRFFSQSVLHFEKAGKSFTPSSEITHRSENVMDKWILAALQSLLLFVKEEMAAYRLYTVVPKLVGFVGQLTNWYIRFNRKRLKGNDGEASCLDALNVLFEVLFTLTKAMSPFTPFFTEYLYKNLRNVLPEGEREDSVHYLMFPAPKPELANAKIEEAVAHMQQVIELGRAARDRRKLPLKYPLSEVTVVSPNKALLENLDSLKGYILAELNVRSLNLTSDEASYVITKADPDKKKLGARLRNEFAKVAAAVAKLSHEEISQFRAKGALVVEGVELTTEDVKITREFKGDNEKFEATWSDEALVVVNLQVDESLRQAGLAREIVNKVQRLRKEAGLNEGDPVETFYRVANDEKGEMQSVLSPSSSFAEYFAKSLSVPLLPATFKSPHSLVIKSALQALKQVPGAEIELFITRLVYAVDMQAVASKYGQAVADTLQIFVGTRSYATLSALLEKSNGKLSLKVQGADVEVELGVNLFPSAFALSKAK